MSEERFNEIEDTIKDLSEKVAHLDKSFAEVNVSLKDYVGWTKQLEKTIKHLDETVKEMNSQHQQIPYERLRDIQSSINPIHKTLREHESEYIAKKDAHILASVSVFFIGGIIILLGIFGNYVITDIASDILKSSKTNKTLIEHNADAIDEHNKVKNEVMRNMHSHKETP